MSASPTRRSVLRMFGAGTVMVATAAAGSTVAGCGLLGGTPAPRLLESSAPLPRPYRTPLPIPPVAEPDGGTGGGADGDKYRLTLRRGSVEILPGLTTPIWGYDGRFPGPTIRARRGRPVTVELTNELAAPTVMHLHGGRTPPESDGYPTDLVAPGERTVHEYPVDQPAATLWYHDHRMGFTGQQVWRGLAGFFLVDDDESDALPLPTGERDIPLMVCDRSFTEDGSMTYPGLLAAESASADAPLDRHGVREGYAGGVLGDVICVNGAAWPRLTVAPLRYRFRLLNGSNARVYEFKLDPAGPLTQVGSDGGLLTTPVEHERLRLAPGERADVVIDFARFADGDRVELLNDAGSDRTARVMRFDIDASATGLPSRDDTAVPKDLATVERLDPEAATNTRTFEFASGDLHGRVGWMINGEPYEPGRSIAEPRLGDVEIWRLSSDTDHPVHLHLSPFQILSVDGDTVDGPPIWKDTIELRAAQTVEILTRFDGYRGRYMLHCHNLEHEDMAMMADFDVV